MAVAKRMATQHAIMLLLDGQLWAAARLARALAAVGASLAAMVAVHDWQLPPHQPDILQGAALQKPARWACWLSS